MKAGFQPLGEPWYADNTREPIRDETLRGLIQVGAVIVRQGIPTTSGKGRYALTAEFAALFDPDLQDDVLDEAIARWQAKHLSASALARIQIARRGAVAVSGRVTVTFPNGETRQLAPGPSSVISKAVIEEFGPRFLAQPAVILLSESESKIIARDDDLANSIGLKIEVSRLLPDIILVDSNPDNFLVVFVEVVASDGPISESRKQGLLGLAAGAHFTAKQIAFVTAYLDRNHRGFKKTVPELAWRSFVWFVTEPDHLVILCEGEPSRTRRLSVLVQ